MTKIKKNLTEKNKQQEINASKVKINKSKTPLQVDAEQRHCLIAEEAYLIAEQRGFQGEDALGDWLQAEACVDTKLMKHEDTSD